MGVVRCDEHARVPASCMPAGGRHSHARTDSTRPHRTLMVTGLVRYACARPSISIGMVALKSSVWWRSGSRVITSLICGGAAGACARGLRAKGGG